MAATTGFEAGIQANDVLMSYGIESTWGTAPDSAFQAIRFTSEDLSGTKTRARPQEINTTQEVSAAVTTQETASGQVAFALSYGTYDGFISVLMRNDWQATQSIAGIAGDITITSGTKVLSSTLASKFTAISQGQWIKLSGFTNAGNNGYWFVETKTDDKTLVLSGTGTITTETPAGTVANVQASTLLNGTQFKSLFIQKKLSASLYLTYPGSFVSQGTISGAVGQFLNGSFQILAKSETSATSGSDNGTVTAAPTGTVNNPVGNFVGVLLDEASIGSVDQFTVQIAANGAAQDFAMGSASAAGIRPGQIMVSGSFRTYFADFTLYTKFTNETAGRLAFISEDGAGNAYVITVPSATLMNPKIVAGGVNQPVYAQFNIEGNPMSTGGSIRFDRLAAAS